MRMTLKRLILVISFALLSILVVACNGKDGGNGNTNNPTTSSSPESVARVVFNALVNFEFDSVLPHVCPERREEFKQQFDELAPLIASQAEAIAKLNIDLSNVTFTVNNQTDTTAEVVITGQVTVNDGTTTFNEEVNTTDNEPMRFSKIENTWYICSDVL